MNKIIKCNLGVQYVAEDADAKNIYVTIIYYDDCLKRRERVRLTYTNIMQLLSSWGACQVEGGCFMAEDFYNPGGRKDLGWVVSLVLNEAYHFNMITKEEYLENANTYIGILRTSMVCNDAQKYFEKAYNYAWKGLLKQTRQFWEKQGVKDLEKYMKKYGIFMCTEEDYE